MLVFKAWWAADLNYRKLAKSHKPTGKTVDLDDDSARVFKSFVTAGKRDGQPWQSNEVVSVVPLAFAVEHLAVSPESIVAEIASWAEDDARRDWYKDVSKITHVAVFGHCRQLTLVDTLAMCKLSFAKIEIPTVEENFSDAGEFFRCQLHENEAKNVGAIKTSLADKVAALYRAIRYGKKPKKESDVVAMLGTNRGMTQKLWALYTVGELLDHGHDRFAMDRPKGEDGKVYDPKGFVPIQLDREALMAKDGGILVDYFDAKKAKASARPENRKDAQVRLDAITAATRKKLETYVAKHVSGTVARTVPTGKKDWQALLADAHVKSLGGLLAAACIDGKLDGFLARYDWLFSLKAVEVDRIGSAREAEAEAETETEAEVETVSTV